jgi:transposase
MKKYPSDINHEIFEKSIARTVLARKQTKPVTVDLYDVFNGILYVLKNGCHRRILPREFLK